MRSRAPVSKLHNHLSFQERSCYSPGRCQADPILHQHVYRQPELDSVVRVLVVGCHSQCLFFVLKSSVHIICKCSRIFPWTCFRSTPTPPPICKESLPVLEVSGNNAFHEFPNGVLHCEDAVNIPLAVVFLWFENGFKTLCVSSLRITPNTVWENVLRLGLNTSLMEVPKTPFLLFSHAVMSQFPGRMHYWIMASERKQGYGMVRKVRDTRTFEFDWFTFHSQYRMKTSDQSSIYPSTFTLYSFQAVPFFCRHPSVQTAILPLFLLPTSNSWNLQQLEPPTAGTKSLFLSVVLALSVLSNLPWKTLFTNLSSTSAVDFCWLLIAFM